MIRPIQQMEGGVDLSACTHFGKELMRIYVSTCFKPLSWDEDITRRTDLFLCDGTIYLRYQKSPNDRNKRPFFFVTHMKPFNRISSRRMFNYEDFLEKCKEDWRFEWIRRTCHIDDRLFDIASQNYGCNIPAVMDFRKYKEACGGETNFTTKGVMEYAIAEKRMFNKMKKEGTYPYPSTRMETKTEEPK